VLAVRAPSLSDVPKPPLVHANICDSKRRAICFPFSLLISGRVATPRRSACTLSADVHSYLFYILPLKYKWFDTASLDRVLQLIF
jgi:hypothetical protein